MADNCSGKTSMDTDAAAVASLRPSSSSRTLRATSWAAAPNNASASTAGRSMAASSFASSLPRGSRAGIARILPAGDDDRDFDAVAPHAGRCDLNPCQPQGTLSRLAQTGLLHQWQPPGAVES